MLKTLFISLKQKGGKKTAYLKLNKRKLWIKFITRLMLYKSFPQKNEAKNNDTQNLSILVNLKTSSL